MHDEIKERLLRLKAHLLFTRASPDDQAKVRLFVRTVTGYDSTTEDITTAIAKSGADNETQQHVLETITSVLEKRTTVTLTKEEHTMTPSPIITEAPADPTLVSTLIAAAPKPKRHRRTKAEMEAARRGVVTVAPGESVRTEPVAAPAPDPKMAAVAGSIAMAVMETLSKSGVGATTSKEEINAAVEKGIHAFQDSPVFERRVIQVGDNRISSILGQSLAEFIRQHPHTSVEVKSEFDKEQFKVPVDPDFYVDASMDKRFAHYDTLSKKGCQVQVLFAGPTGCGKTELSMQLAARTSRPVFVADCANRREPRDWFGRRGATSGSTTWEETAFVNAVEHGGFVILLEEMNRAPANVLNGIFGLLDRRRGAFIEEAGRRINVGPDTLWVATMNEGSEYTGTFGTDAAIRSRFSRRIEVGWIPKDKEQQLLLKRVPALKTTDAERLAEVAATVRAKSGAAFSSGSKITRGISTRQLIDAAYDLVALGVDGLRDCIISHYDADGADSERMEVLSIFQGKWPSIKGS